MKISNIQAKSNDLRTLAANQNNRPKIDMAEEKWQKVKKIFDDALRQKPKERRRFVLEACGEDKTLLVAWFHKGDKRHQASRSILYAKCMRTRQARHQNLNPSDAFL